MGENESATGLAITIPEEVFNDLDRLEGKIKSLEVITNDVSNKIVASFLKMANGVDPFIKKVKLAGKSLSNMFPSGNEQMEKFMSSLVDVANALNRLGSGRQPVTGTLGDPDEVARLTSELKKQQQEIDRLNKSIETLRKQRKSSSAEEKAATTAETTFRRAMFATEATMNQRINKIAKLREAERQLTATGRDYSEQIRTIRAEMDRLNKINQQAVATTDRVRKSQRHLMDISGQLMRRLALVFSVSQMTQYVQKLAQTRGEFELKNAALTAILQNKDEADQLFGQITQLAVQSPFQLKELVTYTKELAAYRIENEKLYDTTKMLADVSAGLGVDMSRLILAYGQVKAANYLRGTELRQFSEAGINILGELATYFSEIENRAVSVGEVFEMVSNRMVTFQDVEEIFRRITSDGGIFANMQEVQARTLAGMISNMQDSVDVMLNEIGKANEEILKGAVEAVTELMINWREVVSMMQKAAVILGPVATYFALSKVAATGFAQSLFNLGTRIPIVSKLIENMMGLVNRANRYGPIAARAANGFVTALGGLATAGITVAIAAISGGLMKLWQEATRAHREMKQLNKELDQIINTDFSNISDSVTTYKELVEKLKNVNKGSGEHRDLIAQINSKYGEYLGYIVTETTSYEQLKASIDAVTESMIRRARMATEEKALQAVYEQQADIISKSQEAIREALTSQPVSGINRRATEKELQDIFRLIEDYVKETGQILTESDFDTILDEYYNTDIKFYDIALKNLRQYSKAVLTTLRNEEIANARINSIYGERYDSEKARAEIEQNNKTWQAELKAAEQRSDLTKWELEQLQKAIDQRYKLQEIDLKVKYNVLTPEEGERQKQQLLKWATQTVEDVNKQVTENLTSQGFSDELISRFLITPDMQSTGMPEIEKTVIASYQQAADSIERFNRLKRAGNEIDEQQLQNVINQQKGWYAVAEALGIVDQLNKNNGKSSNDALSRINKQIDVIKKAGKAYEEARKNLNPEAATEKIRKDYAAVFSEAGIGDLIGTMSFDAEGIIAALMTLIDAATKEAGNAGRFAVEKSVADAKIKIGISEIELNRQKLQDEIDDVFADYKLSLGFKEMGGTEAMADLLGFDYTDLDDLGEKVREVTSKLYSSGGTEDIKAAKKIQEEYDKIVLENLRENTKKYLEYLNESKDERLKIEEDYQRRLAELQDTQLNKQQKQQATANLTRERDRKLAEYDWEQFKGLDLYRTAFEDLERVGESTLNTLLSQLEYFASTTGQTLPTEDFRELMNALKNVRDELESRNPLQAIVDGIREYREATEELAVANANYEAAMRTVTQDRQVQQQAQQEVSQATTDYASAENAEQRRAALERLSVAEMNLVEANARLEQSEQDLKAAADKVAGAYDSQRSAQAKAIQNGQEAISQYNEMSGQVNNIINAVKELADGLGIAFDDETSAAIEGFQKGFSVLGTVMSAIIPIITAITVGGYAMQTALWPLLVIGAALGSIFAIIGAHDAKRDKIIENEKKNVEELQEQYDELHDHMVNALTFEDLDNATEQTRENLEAQIESLDKAIAASLDKKKFDEDEYEDLLKQREEAEEALRQNEIDRIQSLGGFGDEASMKDAAQDFIDSWLDAYKETGDGLDALTDKWNEYIENVIANQMRLKVMDKYLEPIMREMDRMLGDSRLDYDEAARLRQMVEQMAPLANDALKQLAEAYGIAIDSADEGALSGLQKGIQGVTEETAQIIEALLNSMRYYTADSNLQLRNIYMILSGNEAMPNPILAELRAQTEQIRAINRLIRNVTASGHPNGGDGIKVFMN